MKDLYNIADWTDIQEHQKIGEILMQSGKIDLNDIGTALDIQNFEKIMFGDILIKIQVISKEDLDIALKLQKQIDTMLKERENNVV